MSQGWIFGLGRLALMGRLLRARHPDMLWVLPMGMALALQEVGTVRMPLRLFQSRDGPHSWPRGLPSSPTLKVETVFTGVAVMTEGLCPLIYKIPLRRSPEVPGTGEMLENAPPLPDPRETTP
jgi:hypothetical protein